MILGGRMLETGQGFFFTGSVGTVGAVGTVGVEFLDLGHRWLVVCASKR